jgi:hypothetical protein
VVLVRIIIGDSFFEVRSAWPNDPSSATRPAGRNDCIRDAPAGFAAAHVRPHYLFFTGDSVKPLDRNRGLAESDCRYAKNCVDNCGASARELVAAEMPIYVCTYSGNVPAI